jgi:hypothetical protein
MKKSVLAFACALFFKLVISPLYVELVGPDQYFDGWMIFFKYVSIVTFIITIPLITVKYLKK